MPRVDWSDGTAWPLYYSGSDGVDGYGSRLNRDAIFGRRFRALTSLFPIGLTDRIIVAGCAFGYLIERFHDAGFLLCWGIDSSSDIENRKGTEARGDVLWVSDEMSGVGRVRNKLNQLTGGREFDWIITESMLESYEDAEVQTILNVCEGALLPGRPVDHCIHIVASKEDPTAPGFDPAFNWKTLAEWNAMRPSHSWLGPHDGYQVAL
jgi:hypothetical protein